MRKPRTRRAADGPERRAMASRSPSTIASTEPSRVAWTVTTRPWTSVGRISRTKDQSQSIRARPRSALDHVEAARQAPLEATDGYGDRHGEHEIEAQDGEEGHGRAAGLGPH